MKQFPRFSESIILQSVTQPQAKVILTAVNALAELHSDQAILEYQ